MTAAAGGTDDVEVPTGDLELTGRVVQASNATFVGRLGDVEVVYKPVRGEKPLWDFPDGTLAGREVATHAVAQATGWDLVPPTWLGDGPFGPGMLQRWQDLHPEDEAVTLVPADAPVPDGWRAVLEGLDGEGRPVVLVHEDSPALRRMAVLDVVTNNADRKGGHVLVTTDGRRLGVDHGLTFHVEPHLRTVLWGWVGEPLLDDELAAVRRVRTALDGSLGSLLGELLQPAEVEALGLRCERLLGEAVFPEPEGELPAVPWPPF